MLIFKPVFIFFCKIHTATDHALCVLFFSEHVAYLLTLKQYVGHYNKNLGYKKLDCKHIDLMKFRLQSL